MLVDGSSLVTSAMKAWPADPVDLRRNLVDYQRNGRRPTGQDLAPATPPQPDVDNVHLGAHYGYVNDVYIGSEKVAEMFDTHLINVALTGLGIAAGVAIAIAAAILGIAAARLHNKTSRHRKLGPARPSVVHGEVSAPAKELERQAA
jgi:hypothetical protein